jgi:hypothetical protein
MTARLTLRIAYCAVVTLAVAAPASAELIGWKWGLTVEQGAFAGTEVSGSWIYDDPHTPGCAGDPNPSGGTECWVPILDLVLNFGGHTFTLADATEAVVTFDPRHWTAWGVNQYNVRPDRLFGDLTQLAIYPGGNVFFVFRTPSELYVHQAAGSTGYLEQFTPVVPVPEPGTLWAMSGVGLALIMGRWGARRSRLKTTGHT